jgi:hypothetical protein
MTELIDYAMPMMRVEKTLKEMHNRLLEQKLGKARELSDQLIVEAKMLRHTLTLMQEQQDAVRKQTEALQERIPATESAGRARRPNGSAAGAAGYGLQGGQSGRQRH